MLVSISSIKINNSEYTYNHIKVTDPLISINYEIDVPDRLTVSNFLTTPFAEVFPKGFEVRISSNNTNLGLDSFVGDIVNTGYLASDSKAWRYYGVDLSRGAIYYGQLQVTDEKNNISSWKSFSFQFNNLPIAYNVSISPVNPGVSDDLSLTYSYLDEDGDLEGDSKIWWYKNGNYQPQLNYLKTIDKSFLSYNDVWSVSVFPFDGYEYGNPAFSSSVTIDRESPVVSNLSIEPKDATTIDPLYANYLYSSSLNLDDNSEIKWYINNSEAIGFDKRLARLNVEAGDEVRFEVSPNDGISGGDFQSSDTITIKEAPIQILELLVENQINPVNIPNLNPNISWKINSKDKVVDQIKIEVGTAPGDNTILTEVISFSDSYVITETLKEGIDYYVSVSGGSVGVFDSPAIASFKTIGNRWKNVSNSTGWTFETTFRVSEVSPPSSSSSSSSVASSSSSSSSSSTSLSNLDSNYYQSIIFNDGTKNAELRFFENSLVFISSNIEEIFFDFTKFNVITVTGKGSDINIFANYVLIFDGTSKFLKSTSEKHIDIGANSSSEYTEAEYINIYYTTEGAFPPSEGSLYNSVVFNSSYQTSGKIDYISGSNTGSAYYSVSEEEKNVNSTIYKYSEYIKPLKIYPYFTDKINCYKISNSQDRHYTCFAHDFGITIINNYLIQNYNNSLDFSINENPVDKSWVKYGDSRSISINNSLIINTKDNQGKAYFSQNRPGTEWFDKVDSEKGWTVAFSITVDPIVLSNTVASEFNKQDLDGIGFYLNDGQFEEVLSYFPDEIYLKNKDVRVSVDNTATRDYVVTGKNGTIKIYTKLITEDSYNLILNTKLLKESSKESNAGRPDSFDKNNIVYSVWHDDSSVYRKIYISTLDKINAPSVWSKPKVIVNELFGAANPSICLDSSDNIYVVFESSVNDKTDLGIVVKNKFGWSSPYRLFENINNSLKPKIAVDNDDNLYLVWEEYKNNYAEIYFSIRDKNNGKWATPYRISEIGKNSLNPAISISNQNLYVSWTEQNDTNSIKVKRYSLTSKSWSSIVNVSENNADFSDIVADKISERLYIVWHEEKDVNFFIAGKILNGGDFSVVSDVQQLTLDNENSKYPRIGIDTGFLDVYVVFESGVEQEYEYINTMTDTSVNLLKYKSSTNSWLSSGTSHYNVSFFTSDIRYSRRPCIPKYFSSNLYITYEAEVSTTDEYISNDDLFSNVWSILYDLTDTSLYLADSSEIDQKVSGKLNRKEIRFGDFSNYRNSKLTFGYIKQYLSQDVSPFSISHINLEEKANDVSINNEGDAFIGKENGLFYLFKDKKIIAKISDDITNAKKIYFSQNNDIYILESDTKIYSSSNYSDFTLWIEGKDILDFVISSDDDVWVLTSSNVVKYSKDKEIIEYYSVNDILSSGSYFKNIYIDPLNYIWISSTNGLVNITKNSFFVYTSSNSSLESSEINDISIINSSLRYIATNFGIYEMFGNFITKITIDDENWNESVEKNNFSGEAIWAFGSSKIYQITKDINNNYILISFTSKNYANYENAECENKLDYNFDLQEEIDNNTLIEVYVNNRILKRGYKINTKGRLTLDSPLNPNDAIFILVRKDIIKHLSLEQNFAEINLNGYQKNIITKMNVDSSDNILATVEGYSNKLVYFNNEEMFTLPYDSIVLDNQPPSGYLVFEKQLTSNSVQLFFEDVSDNISGVKEMKISGYPNLTADGTEELPWVPYRERFEFNLGSNLGNIFESIIFEGSVGTSIHNYKNFVLLGTGNSPAIYSLDTDIPTDNENNYITSETFSKVFSFSGEPSDTVVEFFVNYIDSVIVGTSSPSSNAKLWISSDGVNYTLLQTLSEQYLLCGTELNGVCYFGTKNGPIYKYNNTKVESTGLTIENGVYSIFGSNNYLWCGTGLGGKIYRVSVDISSGLNPFTPTFLHTERDTIISSIVAIELPSVVAGTTAAEDDFIIFATAKNNGRIIKSINRNPFGPSLSTTPTNGGKLKIDNENNLYACFGKNVYKYQNRSWKPLYTNSANVLDIAFNSDGFWIVYETGVKRVLLKNQTKKIFFALRDAAGNSTEENNITAITDFEEINIEDLRNFLNSNRILQLDENGNEIFRYAGDGDSSFYSANKIEQEKAEYYSEIFNGTSDLVAWNLIYWDASVPDDTNLFVDIRTGLSRDEVLVAEFNKTFTKDQFEGGDITSLSGQYLQFRIRMTTDVRGKSPKLYRINVQAITRSSTHFFTTNFILPSSIDKGILTATTFIPIASDIIFGVDTNDSTDFSTYQTVELNRIFTLPSGQSGKNLRIGVKLVSPLNIIGSIDMIEEYNEYSEGVYNNTIEFEYVPTSSGSYNFAVQFFEDPEMTQLLTTLYSSVVPEAWSINGVLFTGDGESLIAGNTYKIIIGIKGNAAIRCNQFYYVKTFSSVNSADLVKVKDDFSFIASCNPNFSNTVEFIFINSYSTGNYNFRIKFYSDSTRTNLVKTYFTLLDSSGWTMNNESFSTGGENIASGDISLVNFVYPNSDLSNGYYYLSIDAFNGDNFISIMNNTYIKITNVEDFICGEYTNVPIAKDIAIMFELDDFIEKIGSVEKTGKTITLNINA